jgi:hypothetical protein
VSVNVPTLSALSTVSNRRYDLEIDTKNEEKWPSGDHMGIGQGCGKSNVRTVRLPLR